MWEWWWFWLPWALKATIFEKGETLIFRRGSNTQIEIFCASKSCLGIMCITRKLGRLQVGHACALCPGRGVLTGTRPGALPSSLACTVMLGEAVLRLKKQTLPVSGRVCLAHCRSAGEFWTRSSCSCSRHRSKKASKSMTRNGPITRSVLL